MLAAAVLAAVRMIGFGIYCIKNGNTVGGISVFFLSAAAVAVTFAI